MKFPDAEVEIEVMPKTEYVEPPQGERDLTDREREVLELIRDGLPDNAIAGKLCLTEGSVRDCLSSICLKLNVNSRALAICYGIELGLISAHKGQ